MTQTIIELKNINKIYDTGHEKVHSLKNITFSIKKGEFIALMGTSGSGKSTLMNILGCLDSPTSGSYLIKEQDASTFDNETLSKIRNKEIGFIFQTFNLLSKSNCIDNVALPLIYAGFSPEKRKQRAIETLKKVSLGDRMYHKPNELSGGQRQRVAIARALANTPSIILADEPTGNLDSKTSHEIMSFLQGLNAKGNTILLVTHEDDIAAYAHRHIRLKDGAIIEDKLNITQTEYLHHSTKNDELEKV